MGQTSASGGGRDRDKAKGIAGGPGVGKTMEEVLSAYVGFLVGVKSDEVFRTILGYL